MRRPGQAEWQQLITEFEASQETQTEFVSRHDVPLATFQFHLYKRRKNTSIRNSESSPTFLPVQVVASAALQARDGEPHWVEAMLRSGVVLRFEAGTDVRYLSELLAALG